MGQSTTGRRVTVTWPSGFGIMTYSDPGERERMIHRKKTHQVMVGDVAVGGDAPVSVQSMTTTLTTDIDATVQQI